MKNLLGYLAYRDSRVDPVALAFFSTFVTIPLSSYMKNKKDIPNKNPFKRHLHAVISWVITVAILAVPTLIIWYMSTLSILFNESPKDDILLYTASGILFLYPLIASIICALISYRISRREQGLIGKVLGTLVWTIVAISTLWCGATGIIFSFYS